MSDLLFGIPIIPWFQETMNAMPIHGEGTRKIWNNCWYEAYKKLGGEKESCGTKGCPKNAAYGLWYLGRIVDSGRTCKYLDIIEINNNKLLGPNAAYAVLYLEMLQQKGDNTTTKILWSDVREVYQQRLNKEAAKSKNGQMEIALALFNANLIIFPSK
ncbi:DUF6979 family protein [Anabaena azotica]|uniref:Uncharacterized protein n=1 Tax=Anabaena azotica FACHB-119 TaxID=947527 RepID=A0ABR8D0F6_9NOST|nr:hypothetical protein [Anabaena azotica]MBD2500431.1 hypothetical protein [Anabaena azotica FACHB-119]